MEKLVSRTLENNFASEWLKCQGFKVILMSSIWISYSTTESSSSTRRMFRLNSFTIKSRLNLKSNRVLNFWRNRESKKLLHLSVWTKMRQKTRQSSWELKETLWATRSNTTLKELSKKRLPKNALLLQRPIRRESFPLLTSQKLISPGQALDPLILKASLRKNLTKSHLGQKRSMTASTI